jgi:hypothetical protein
MRQMRLQVQMENCEIIQELNLTSRRGSNRISVRIVVTQSIYSLKLNTSLDVFGNPDIEWSICFAVEEVGLVGGEVPGVGGGGVPTRQSASSAILFMRLSEMKGQDKTRQDKTRQESASTVVLQRIQSRSCYESGTHCPKITSLLLEA